LRKARRLAGGCGGVFVAVDELLVAQFLALGAAAFAPVAVALPACGEVFANLRKTDGRGEV
jgi:hypothetical protein